MAFTPQDFILQDLSPVPEGLEKALLEYDSKSKLILVRTEDATNSGYKYQSVYLGNELNNNVLTGLPDEYHHTKDQLLFFAIYEDGTFYAMKQKLKYSFKEDKSFFVKYDVDDLTLEDATTIFNVLKATVFIQIESDVTARDKAVLEILEKDAYLEEVYSHMVQERDELLRESDFRVLDDYPETFSGEKVLWTQWRAKLRDVVKAPNAFDDQLDYLIYKAEFKWPIDPLVYHSEYRESGRYLETDDQYRTHPESVSTPKQIYIKRNEISIINNQKLRNEKGVPVDKQLYDVMIKYKLTEGLFDFDINTLSVSE